MTKIAISIVLLPSKDMINKTIEMNKELGAIHNDEIILGLKENVPHITICMGAVFESEIPEVITIIDKISNQFTQFEFEAKLKVQISDNNEKITWLSILNKEKIQELHEFVMNKMRNYLDFKIEKRMLIKPETIRKSTISWIKSYSNIHDDPILYEPHITIGMGETAKNDMNFKFYSAEMALFQLGNYCTCARLIYSTNLNEQQYSS